MSATIIKQTDYGDTASFFRLSFMAIDRENLQVTIIIRGYVSQEAYNEKAKHKVSKEYILEGDWLAPYLNDLETNPLTVSQLFELFYSLTVGQDPYFLGATKI